MCLSNSAFALAGPVIRITPASAIELGHTLEKDVIFGGMPTTDAIGFVMQVPGGMIRMYDELIGVRRIEMEHAGFAMIDPNHGMIVC